MFYIFFPVPFTGNIIQYASGTVNPTPVARSGREMLPLSALSDISLPGSSGTTATTMLSANMLKLSFVFHASDVYTAAAGGVDSTAAAAGAATNGGDSSPNPHNTIRKELCISPVAIDCVRLRAILLEIKRKFVN